MKIHAKSPLPGLMAVAFVIALVPVRAGAQSALDASVLAGPCANCHGTDGRSPGVSASIAGRPETVLRAQLGAFKSDNPPAGTTIMNRIAKGYSEAELDALAKYFSQRRAQVPAKTKERK